MNNIYKLSKQNVVVFMSFMALLVFCICFKLYKNQSDDSKIIGEWNIKYFNLNGHFLIEEGTMKFDESGIVIVTPKYQIKAGTMTWKSYLGNIIDIGELRYKYQLHNDNLQLIRFNTGKTGHDYGYISLVKLKSSN